MHLLNCPCKRVSERLLEVVWSERLEGMGMSKFALEGVGFRTQYNEKEFYKKIVHILKVLLLLLDNQISEINILKRK